MRILKPSGPMDKEIMPRELIEVVQFPTLEEFKTLCSTDATYKSALVDKLADRYDKIPMLLRLLKNLEPTGIISCFADGLSEIKAKRKEEKLWKTIYELVKAVFFINQKLGKIDPQYFESQVIALTEMYFDHSMRAYQLEKIEIFRNAFIQSVIDYDRAWDEKENIYNLIASLTMEQIRILKLCYELPHNENYLIYSTNIVEELKLDEPYIIQLCSDLIGKGLLIGMDNSRSVRGPMAGYYVYRIGDYLEYIIKYISEPNELNTPINLKHS